MQIQRIGLIGLGSIGILYGNAFQRAFGRENVCFIVDPDRAARYTRDGVQCNGVPCDFRYETGENGAEPVDLLLFCVKYPGLADATQRVRPFVGAHTILVSTLNGVVSEGEIAAVYGDKLLYCTVQGMDATRDGVDMRWTNAGYLALGEAGGGTSARLEAVCAALDRAGLAYRLPDDIRHQLWSKFMLNVGVNQVTAAHGLPYAGVQQPGAARDEMRAAMVEAQRVAACESVTLTDREIDDWIALIDTLDPCGMTSMRQDTLRGRKTELDLFAGTVRRLGVKHGIPTPVNDTLYDAIRAIEARRAPIS